MAGVLGLRNEIDSRDGEAVRKTMKAPNNTSLGALYVVLAMLGFAGMDAMSKWLVAELVRVLHTLTTTEASEIVEALIERQVVLVWSSGDKKRVLKPGLTWKKNTLLLLLTETGEVAAFDCFSLLT